jgi:hypothetical protein
VTNMERLIVATLDADKKTLKELTLVISLLQQGSRMNRRKALSKITSLKEEYFRSVVYLSRLLSV